MARRCEARESSSAGDERRGPGSGPRSADPYPAPGMSPRALGDRSRSTCVASRSLRRGRAGKSAREVAEDLTAWRRHHDPGVTRVTHEATFVRGALARVREPSAAADLEPSRPLPRHPRSCTSTTRDLERRATASSSAALRSLRSHLNQRRRRERNLVSRARCARTTGGPRTSTGGTAGWPTMCTPTSRHDSTAHNNTPMTSSCGGSRSNSGADPQP